MENTQQLPVEFNLEIRAITPTREEMMIDSERYKKSHKSSFEFRMTQLVVAGYLADKYKGKYGVKQDGFLVHGHSKGFPVIPMELILISNAQRLIKLDRALSVKGYLGREIPLDDRLQLKGPENRIYHLTNQGTNLRLELAPSQYQI